MSLLGIDVGTTGCKAAAFAADGRQLCAAYREYATLHPADGWAELDSREVLACVKAVIAEVAAGAKHDPVTALCVSSMGEAMTPVSSSGEILDRCILSSDVRGGDLLADALGGISREAFYDINPNILGPNYSLPKLLWIRKNRPEVYKAADKFLLWGDLVTSALGCEPITSFSLANRTLLFDIRRQDWSDELLGLSGIDRDKLPPIAASGTIAGGISAKAAAELGLRKDTAVVVGGHDQCCASLGAGVRRAGQAVCGIGTFECITPTFDRIPESGSMLANGLNVEHHVLPGLYVSFLYNQSGSLVRWFRDTFASADKQLLAGGQDIYDALAAEMPDAPTRLLTLPYFEATGSPHFIIDAAGAIVGLKTHTHRGEILKSIMESATFYFVEPLDFLQGMGIDTSEFVATGGGAKSDRWLQIKADILGVPFRRPVITECGVLGAAMLAGLGTGALQTPADAIDRFVRPDRTFEPDARRHDAYRERIRLYQQLYPALRQLLGELQSLRTERGSATMPRS